MFSNYLDELMPKLVLEYETEANSGGDCDTVW